MGLFRTMNVATFSLLVLAGILYLSEAAPSRSSQCPLVSSMKSCSPRCANEGECSSNQKCCPNLCGSSSCTGGSGSVSIGHSGSSSPKSGSGGEGVVCGNVKCSSNEKCVAKRPTERPSCTRA